MAVHECASQCVQSYVLCFCLRVHIYDVFLHACICSMCAWSSFARLDAEVYVCYASPSVHSPEDARVQGSPAGAKGPGPRRGCLRKVIVQTHEGVLMCEIPAQTPMATVTSLSVCVWVYTCSPGCVCTSVCEHTGAGEPTGPGLCVEALCTYTPRVPKHVQV